MKVEPAVGGGCNKATNFSRRKVLACLVCASDRCHAIDTLRWNHVNNKRMEGPNLATSLEANVANSTEFDRTYRMIACLKCESHASIPRHGK